MAGEQERIARIELAPLDVRLGVIPGGGLCGPLLSMSTAWKKRNLGPDADSASIFHPPKRAKQEEDVKVKEELTPARQTNLARSLVKHDTDVTDADQTPVPAPRAASVKKEQQQANPTSSTTPRPTPRTYYEMDTAPESDQDEEEEDSGDDKTTKFRFMNPKAAAANASRFQSKH